MRRLILRTFQSPGDVVMLTAAVRDLHRAHPGRFVTDVRTSADDLWRHNPRLTPLREGDAGVEVIDMHYPLIHHSNQRPYHFLHGYAQFLERRLGVPVPVTQFHGDIHLSDEERRFDDLRRRLGRPLPERYWVLVAGGKYDFTAKWWNPARAQEVIDALGGKVTFVRCGGRGHWHPPLAGVIDLVGRTSLREFVRVVHHAAGVLCPVTLAMHLAAAVPTRPDSPPLRPCVVVAGGREPPHWEAYPGHQFLHTVGMLACCARGGCWRSRCQPVGDGDEKDRHNLCEHPVQIAPNLKVPRCLEMIPVSRIIECIENFEAMHPPA
jgi:ADP-heptose:LPS heptosyltransferase